MVYDVRNIAREASDVMAASFKRANRTSEGLIVFIRAEQVIWEFETNSKVSAEVVENKPHKEVARLGRFELPTLSSGG
jgi:hypothetical protein